MYGVRSTVGPKYWKHLYQDLQPNSAGSGSLKLLIYLGRYLGSVKVRDPAWSS
jgi:hypothetical protein